MAAVLSILHERNYQDLLWHVLEKTFVSKLHTCTCEEIVIVGNITQYENY